MRCTHRLAAPGFLLALLVFACMHPVPAGAAGSHWIRISSDHFSVLTDASARQGDAVILRFEQMRAVFGQLLLKNKVVLSEPLDIIAFKTTEEYAAVAPGHGGAPASSGTFVPGDDRNYILLDLSDETSWQTMTVDLARVLLRYNYPPTPAWFDQGFLEYFSSLQLGDKLGNIGGDPGPFSRLLDTQSWIPVEEFLSPKPLASTVQASAMFRAESWIVMHYLISNHKLPETGAYFGLVENQGLPVGQAVQQAYGISLQQFEQAIKTYAHSVLPRAAASPTALAHQFLPLTPVDVGTSSQSIAESEADALVDEAAVRAPEHQAQAVKNLTALGNDVKTDNAVAHRALAWVLLQKADFQGAADELSKASDRNPNDPWVHYYAALLQHREGEASGEFPGLANIMQDLRAVIDWDPEFAQAYDMLAVSRLQGGGTNSALPVMRTAIELSPRDQTYLLHLAQIYLAGKKWDDAAALLTRLTSSPDAQVASAAKQDLEDLPTLKKYGILPQRGSSASQSGQAVYSSGSDDDDDSSTPSVSPPSAPPIDRRKVHFLQGQLLSVDCSNAPVAILRIVAGKKTLRFRTADYKSLLLIGADTFSCEWRSQPVVVNYKAGGKADGDLVSLELR